jgi:hypothetical protein
MKTFKKGGQKWNTSKDKEQNPLKKFLFERIEGKKEDMYSKWK